jgi:tetratricopeptide (TPR) repeat protein
MNQTAAAEALYRAGDYAAAAALLEPLAIGDPPPHAALRILGLCRLRLGAPLQGLGLLERAHAQAPDDAWCRLHYGIGLQNVGRHDQAAALFRACQTLLPDDPAPALNLSSSLLSLGDRQGAIRAARKARLRAPTMPETHYALGLSYLAADLLDRALDCFQQAARLAPRFADAWINIGVICYRKGAIEAAKRAMRTALAADPDNHAAAANLGGFLRLTGEAEAAETLLRGILRRQPHALAARINLAADLLLEDRAPEALELLDLPAPADPSMRQHWLLQQALALIKLRRLVEAHTLLGSLGPLPAALEPLLRWRQVLLAVAEGNADLARHLADEMEALLQAPSVLPEHRIMGHYDLAKFWTGQQQPDRAFPCWAAGHRLLAAVQPFSRQDCSAVVDATIANFDAARLSGVRAANRDQAPVFIVGMPRSGTTLTEQILSAHAEVHGAGERLALGQACWQLGGANETAAAARIAALDGPALDAAADRYLRELHALDPGARRIVDKMPGNFRHLGPMALLLPGARVIACDRDPRDIGLSIFTFRFYGSHGYAHDLADLGWYIGQHRRLMAHWRAVLPNPIMTVHLRDWVEDFSGTLRRVLDFLELAYDARCEAFHDVQRRVRTVSRTQVQERVNGRGLGRWRAYERHLAPLIDALEASGALDDG